MGRGDFKRMHGRRRMQAVILAAGQGKRLRPITFTRPKPLVPLLNKPMILHNLEVLSRAGIDDFVIVVGYMGEKIKEEVERAGYRARFVEQRERNGTGHALLQAEKYAKEEFLVVYGDVLLSREVEKVIAAGANAIAGFEVEDPWNYGVIAEKNGRLVSIVEKPEKGREPSRLINAGIYFLSRDVFSLLEEVKPSPRGEIELTDAVSMMDERVVRLEEWQEIGKPWHLLQANMRALEKIKRRIEGEVEEGARVKGNVIVEEGAVVKSGSYIEGPAYIAKGVEIGPNSYIRRSVILSGSKIGNAVEVKGSVIMENVRAKHLSYIGDSIICENVNLGAGTIIANLRFDGKEVKMSVNGRRESTGMRKFGAVIGAGVKTGVNVSIMPGVKIAPNSVIMPGTVVRRDVE